MSLRRRGRIALGVLYQRTTDVLPPDTAARLDFARPHLRAGWGGAFNGQRQRQDIVRDLYQEVGFKATVETGSFRGESTEFLSVLADHDVTSVESNPRFLGFARRRCANRPNVEFHQGDSRSFLATHLRSLGGPAFFYLDAHWYADLPLADEVRAIAASGVPSVVMVDDFEVPDDSGYEFDDYGPGKRLTRALLDDSGIEDWAWYYPSAPSSTETGLRRGSVVICSPQLTGQVDRVAGLRRAFDASS